MSDIQKSRKVRRRRRSPGELATPLTAIRNHCLECCGYNSGEVSRCSVRQCWLYPYRSGKGTEGERIARDEAQCCESASSSEGKETEGMLNVR